jgi:MerR family redox-sensitive transcriptional activator SoxR
MPRRVQLQPHFKSRGVLQDPSQPLGIGEVARLSGLRPSAVRFYESRRLISPPERRGGQRRYRPSVLDELALVQLAAAAGFSLAETARLVSRVTPGSGRAEAWRDLATRKLAEIDSQRERLDRMRAVLRRALASDCVTLEECAPILRGTAACARPGTRARRARRADR